MSINSVDKTKIYLYFIFILVINYNSLVEFDYNVLQCSTIVLVLHCTTMCYNAPPNTNLCIPHYNLLHCTTLHYSVLHCTTWSGLKGQSLGEQCLAHWASPHSPVPRVLGRWGAPALHCFGASGRLSEPQSKK